VPALHRRKNFSSDTTLTLLRYDAPACNRSRREDVDRPYLRVQFHGSFMLLTYSSSIAAGVVTWSGSSEFPVACIKAELQ